MEIISRDTVMHADKNDLCSVTMRIRKIRISRYEGIMIVIDDMQV